MEPPPIDAVIEAEVLLRQIGAYDERDELTPLGRILARLPVEPRLGRMLVLGTIFQAGGNALQTHNFQYESIQGDALTTIAAATSAGSEVFLTDTMKGRLTYRQIGFSGTRHSDHLAALAAFQARTLSPTHEL